jgi:hypothetical protein
MCLGKCHFNVKSKPETPFRQEWGYIESPRLKHAKNALASVAVFIISFLHIFGSVGNTSLQSNFECQTTSNFDLSIWAGERPGILIRLCYGSSVLKILGNVLRGNCKGK